MDFSEKWGQSVEEAVQLALQDLKLTIDEVEVTVLEEPTKGFLGFGAKLAKVRVEKKAAKKTEKQEKQEKPQKAEKRFEHFEKPVKAEAKTETKTELKAEAKPERRPERRPEKKVSQRKEKKFEKIEPQAKPADCVPVTEHAAITFLKEVIDSMGLDLTITACMNDECIYLDIDGRDSGTLIGKRGATLDAIQYLTSLVVNKSKENYMRVVVDAENYRAKREKTLEQLANRLADKVVRTRKSVRLEPMNPYERKVIHATLQSSSQVITRSEGEEPYRRIIIELVK
jgi:spoIIIJ-associated protein